MSDDQRARAARYLVDKLAKERGEQTLSEAERERDELRARAGKPTSSDRALFVDSMIQDAIRRGEFDDLPGAGKPLEGLTGRHDPDWWIRRKIEREQLTGLGPPAITLRTEARELQHTIDALHREDDVRALLEDFNTRVREAARQLQGGPPVVTKPRDVEAELSAWRERRNARYQGAADRRAAADAHSAMNWRERRRARRRNLGR